MKLCDQKGLALVETAVSIMLLFIFVFGITELGRALYMKNILVNAAREGARYAAVSPTKDLNVADVETRITNAIPFDDKAGLAISINPQTNLQHATTPITVQVSIPYRPLIPAASLPDMVLKGQAQMLYE